jgi:hypothetical protein
MRTQGILLVREAIRFQGILTADREHHMLGWTLSDLTYPTPGVKFSPLRKSCDRMLQSLEEFSQKLLDDIKTFRQHGDKNGADIVSSTCVTCLAHLAVLYEVIGRNDCSAEAKTDDLCDSALRRLGTLTSELHFDEYTYLDLLLGVRQTFFICWKDGLFKRETTNRTLGGNR